MKYLRRFGQEDREISIYDKNWEKLLPEKITILKGYDDDVKTFTFKKGNIMINSDMLQITYELSPHQEGVPDTLEIDIYFVTNVIDSKIELDIDITFGDEVAVEFKISPPNKVNLIQHTSYHSKFDPSNTVFAFDDYSLKEFISFLNRFNKGMNLTTYDVRFLDKNDNWK
jgi:hypothetical protein